MENKVVCYYCGTIYDSEQEKCPLCGSTARTTAAEEPVSQQVRTKTTPQARQPVKTSGKFATEKSKQKSTRGILIASLVFLALSVFVVFYFIGDMIGWWPGLEDNIERPSVQVEYGSTDCKSLEVDPALLTMNQAGQEVTFDVEVNIGCALTVSCVSSDDSVVTVSEEATVTNGEDTKTATFTATATGEGKAVISITCGAKSAEINVLCNYELPDETGDPTDEDLSSTDEEDTTEEDTTAEPFEPELNYSDASFHYAGQTLQLSVKNLPEGLSVKWTSWDEEIATVDENGLVTSVSPGTTNIAAEVDGKTVDMVVRCNFEDSNEIDRGAHLASYRTDVTIKVGEKFDLYLYDSDSNHIDDITYSIANPNICSVSNNYVTGLAEGTTTVTVHWGEYEFKCTVRVND